MTSSERHTGKSTGIKYPIRRLRVALSGLLFLFILFFIGGIVLFIPAFFFVSAYGDIGWLLGLAVVAALVLYFSYRSFRQTIDALLTDAEQVSRQNYPELTDVLEFIEAEARERDMATPYLYIHPAPIANAMAVGRKNQGYIILCDGLLTDLDNKEELKAVIAHEMAHLSNRDTTLLTLMVGTKQLIINFWTWIGYAVKKWSYERRGVVLGPREEEALKQKARKRSRRICSPIGLCENSVSRHREYIADLEGARTTDPDAMIGALESVAESNYEPAGNEIPQSLCIHGSRDGILARLRADHPPIDRRVRNIEKNYSELQSES